MEAMRADDGEHMALARRCLALAFALVTALLGLGACGAGGGEPQADSQLASSAGEDRDDQRRSDSWGNPDNFLAVEEAPVPDMWLVEEFGSMSDWQRRKFANATDAETFGLLVERYGADTMEGYRDE